MPYLNLKLGTPESAATTVKLVAALTDLTAEVLKKKRELTAVAVEHISPERWFIGGAALVDSGQTGFYLDIKITEGTNTKDEKAAYVAQVFAAVETIIGSVHPTSYIVIDEVRGDAWGYQGLTQECRYIRGKTL